jgi:hypothetical protein
VLEARYYFVLVTNPTQKENLALCLTVSFSVKAIFLCFRNVAPSPDVYVTSRIPKLRKELVIKFYTKKLKCVPQFLPSRADEYIYISLL